MDKGISSAMFKKLSGFLVRHHSTGITEIEANKIQTADYVLNKTEIKKKFTPTYTLLYNELESEDPQIFESGVYYLTQIALNKVKYRNQIADLLETKVKDNHIKPEFRDRILKSLKEIKEKINQK